MKCALVCLLAAPLLAVAQSSGGGNAASGVPSTYSTQYVTIGQDHSPSTVVTQVVTTITPSAQASGSASGSGSAGGSASGNNTASASGNSTASASGSGNNTSSSSTTTSSNAPTAGTSGVALGGGSNGALSPGETDSSGNNVGGPDDGYFNDGVESLHAAWAMTAVIGALVGGGLVGIF